MRTHTNVLWRHSRDREGSTPPAKTHRASLQGLIDGETMSTKYTPVLRSVRRARDVLIAYEPKSNIAGLAGLRQDLHHAGVQLIGGSAAREAVSKQSKKQMIETKPALLNDEIRLSTATIVQSR